MTGTISEERRRKDTALPDTTETPTTIKTTVIEVVEKQSDLDQVQALDTTTKPNKPKEPKPVKDSKCTFCKANDIATLSFRFGLVLVLVALSYHLFKSPK